MHQRPTPEQSRELQHLFQELRHEERDALLEYGRRLLSPGEVDVSMFELSAVRSVSAASRAARSLP